MFAVNFFKVLTLCVCISKITGQLKFFGTSKEYQCHCNGVCDDVTGDCQWSCDPGWMGPQCQYVNLAIGESAYISGTTPNALNTRVTDGDITTCQYVGWRKPQWTRVVLSRPKWITWIQIVTRTALDEGLTVTLRSTGSESNCDSIHSRRNGTVYDMVCQQAILASTVIVSFPATTTAATQVCEIRINGGMNVALKKPTNQTSNHYSKTTRMHYGSSLAVDGGTSQEFWNNSCTHTTTGCSNGEKTWTVDMEYRFVISMVRIYNRDVNQERLSGFSLRSNNDGGAWNTIFTDRHSIYENPGDIIDIVPDSIIEARYLEVSIPRCRSSAVLTLCEVQVFTARPPCGMNLFGIDCDDYCFCKSATETCDVISGYCASGCETGYVGDSCGTQCDVGYYGDGCLKTCPNCKDWDCNPIDGSCFDVCEPGWMVQNGTCDGACTGGTFGQDCNFTCWCGNEFEICDKANGHCTSGCATGYEGPGCQQKCTRGTYGDGCHFNCSSFCFDEECDHVKGTCTRGCKPGYKGDRCSEQCEDELYGAGCNQTCSENCKPYTHNSRQCNIATGACHVGCQPGWITDTCETACQSGWYGEGCRSNCGYYCKDRECHHVNGTCSKGCKPGRQGDNCTDTCTNGRFGQDCNFTCRCRNEVETCDKVTGYCKSGCAAGYRGTPCQQTCQSGWYGEGCSYNCGYYCKDRECHHVNGTCSKGCVAGRQGDMCKDTCENGYYGENCALECSENCKPGSPRLCYNGYGKCLRGCKPGWITSTCKTKCKAGRYGDGCRSTCSRNCEGGVCHNVNGSCTEGCVPGKHGDMCDEDCPVGQHGADCRYNCSEGCKTESCDRVSGICDGGCGPGWLGLNCSQVCPSGYYGDGCVTQCSGNCDDSVCDNVNGSCTQGCIAGYKGDNCTQGCESGTYGRNCQGECSDGCTGNQCNGTDGRCSCVPGRLGSLCELSCETGLYGLGCLQACSANCDVSGCHGVTGQCLTCQSGWSGDTCQDAAGMSTGMIAGLVVAALLLILLALVIALFVLRRRLTEERQGESVPLASGNGQKKSPIEREEEEEKLSDSQADLLLGNKAQGNGEVGDVYYNIGSTCPSSTVVTLAHFPQYVRRWRLDKQHLYDEFQKLPKDLTHDRNVAMSPQNVKKNRYKNICAYDHSRVVLTPDPDNQFKGDYINACYVDTPKKQKAFIAAQGPNEFIINDFVRMLWELKIGKVVMLTNLFEEGKIKCNQYWPDENEKSFDDIIVKLRKTTTHADYTIRTLVLRKANGKPRTVTQFHFTAWPDKGVPRSAVSLLDFRDKVMTYDIANPAPVVVHCSAGIGRTGTFIALQYLKEEAELSSTQDVYTCVWSLRQQRVNMVQTKDQYVFIHEACLVSLVTSPSVLSLDTFQKHAKTIIADSKRLETEFKVLKEFPVHISEDEFTVSKTEENKNRFSSILAGESKRPVLTPNPDYEETLGTYINAVFLPGFDGPQKFIETQTPLPNTVVDMWRLVADYDVTMIIMLDNFSQGDNDVAVYWPDVKSPLEMDFCRVECVNVSQNDEMVIRNLELKNGDTSKSLVHITVKFWKDALPQISSMLQLVRMCNDSQVKNPGSPVIVHCRCGVEKSGLFCAVAAIIERIHTDHTVAVPTIVGNLKAIREQNIPTVAQYKYCYETAAEYAEAEVVYSNAEVENKEPEEAVPGDVYCSLDDEHIYSNQ